MAEPTKLPVTMEKKPVPAATPAPFEALRRDIDRVFESLRLAPWGLPFARHGFEFEMPSLREAGLAPAVDVTEKPTEYEITAELPGMDEKDVEVKLANGTLTIRGEKRDEKEEREKDYYLSERRYGAFLRSFRVPDGVDAAKIEASVAKGILTVRLPKSAEAQKGEKKIAVRAA